MRQYTDNTDARVPYGYTRLHVTCNTGCYVSTGGFVQAPLDCHT